MRLAQTVYKCAGRRLNISVIILSFFFLINRLDTNKSIVWVTSQTLAKSSLTTWSARLEVDRDQELLVISTVVWDILGADTLDPTLVTTMTTLIHVAFR